MLVVASDAGDRRIFGIDVTAEEERRDGPV